MGDLARVLVVDDDPEILRIVTRCLESAGYRVTTAEQGLNVAAIIRDQDIDLAIVDLILPDTDGLALTRLLKERFNLGIIILSGQGETTERIIGLEVGADDYVVKPFEPRELLARVRSVLRRLNKEDKDHHTSAMVLGFEGWRLDVAARKLTSPEGHPMDLTSGEFNLRQAFAEHPNKVLNRDQLLDLTHKGYTPAFDRSVDVQIGRLRKKIESVPTKPELIKTVRNAGYIFAPKVTRT